MGVIDTLSFIGSLASIASLILSIKSKWFKKTWVNIVMYSFLLITSGSSGILFYLYKQSVNEQLQIENRKLIVKQEATNLLKSAPAYISYYEPGESEGLLYSTLSLLEKNKDLFPETYEVYKRDVIEKIESVNREDDISKKREKMEIAGNSALRLLKSLSQ
ncbi:MAG: hypothetical protein K2K45_09370 [Muribaculaceae bacterium]|nr:hypothetical protein [Muribaculaceae bacterium]